MVEPSPAKLVRELPVVTVRELSRNPGAVVARVLRGERLIVCRHGRPVATLQPLDGVIVQPLTGHEQDVTGSPLGDPSAEIAKLSDIHQQILTRCVRFDKVHLIRLTEHGFSKVLRAAEELQLRGLARKCDRGLVLTGRGMVIREALLAREGLAETTSWKIRGNRAGRAKPL